VTGSVTWSPNADAQFLSLSILTIDARESFKGSLDGHPQVIEVNLTSGKGFSDQAFIGRGQVFEFLDSTQQLSADDGTLSGTLTGKVTYNYTPASTAPPPVPEPPTWAMMLLGLMGLGFGATRRKPSRSLRT
jgi:hypothetical protein